MGPGMASTHSWRATRALRSYPSTHLERGGEGGSLTGSQNRFPYRGGNREPVRWARPRLEAWPCPNFGRGSHRFRNQGTEGFLAVMCGSGRPKFPGSGTARAYDETGKVAPHHVPGTGSRRELPGTAGNWRGLRQHCNRTVLRACVMGAVAPLSHRPVVT